MITIKIKKDLLVVAFATIEARGYQFKSIIKIIKIPKTKVHKNPFKNFWYFVNIFYDFWGVQLSFKLTVL